MRLAALVFACLWPLAGGAERFALAIDAQRSVARFELGATLHTVRGTAAVEPGGRILFDASGGEASGRVEVDATSAETGTDARDRNMHEQVLESARFPRIAFTAQRLSVTRTGPGEADFVLYGALEIHGGVHEVALEGRARGELPGRLSARAQVVLPYVAWGMQDVSNFLLSVEPEVQVRLEVEGEVTPAAADAGAP